MKKSGFTLIELVMVITILAIIASVALPRFLNFNKQAELSIAKNFNGVLHVAHESYFLRLVVQENVNGTDAVGKSATFFNFVGFSDSSSSSRNTVDVGQDMRRLLIDPNAEVYVNGSLVFNFKSGATATYYISDTGAITAEYSGF
jgi:prepilin-type N-terminal cleavage/methylation domain-containing protein